MNILSKLFWWRGETGAVQAPEAGGRDANRKLVSLPEQPYVFECEACGKVFEARRRPPCPECDGSDVVLLSE